MDVQDFVNENPPGARLGLLMSYIREETVSAPIDMYRESVRQILEFGSIERLRDSEFIGRLLAVGIVSAAEGYVRAILAACVEICPLCRASAASKTIHLGGLLWHGKSGFSKSAFEHSSFASREELTKALRDFVSFRMEDSKFKILLEEYDKVCHLRHGIVHGDGLLPGRNAVYLEIPSLSNPLRIHLKYAELQEIAAVVNTLILSINRELFAEMCKRWAIDWRRRADWDASIEDQLFGKLWSLFHSKSEWSTRRGRSSIRRSACLLEVKAQFNL